MVKARETLIPKPAETAPALADPPPAAASVIGLSKSFGKTSVLQNISFDVAEGEVLVLLGASGSGKTTILRIIAGLEMPYTGKVILHGKDVTELPARERGVGVIFQSYALFPKMTVEKNIGYGLRIRKRKRKEIRETVEELLKLVQLEEHRKKYPSQLSGGQQQRVAIARTLAYKPEVLLFDEPFGALDTQTRVHLRREIRALLRKVNVPSIFITHDQEEALELGDRVAVLNAGRIEQLGTPYEIYSHPATEYVATFLGAANILEATVRNGDLEVGTLRVPAVLDQEQFQNGDCVKIVFRPEDDLDAVAILKLLLVQHRRHTQRAHLKVPVPHCRFENVRCAEESRNVFGRRVTVDFVRRSKLLDAARVQYRNAIAEFQRLFLIVRDEDRRHIYFSE